MLSSELGAAREQLRAMLDDDLAGLWQRHALGPPVADDAIARLVLAADPVALIATERENAVVVLAEIEEDVTSPRRRRAPPHGRDRAQCRAWEPHEIRVVLETARHCGSRAADTNRLETRVDEDGAPGISDASAPGFGDELLDTAVLARAPGSRDSWSPASATAVRPRSALTRLA